MYPAAASGVVGIGQVSIVPPHLYALSCRGCSSSSSSKMIERSLGIATPCREKLLPPHAISTSVRCQTSAYVSMRAPSQYRGQAVENGNFSSLRRLSRVSQVTSSTGCFALGYRSASTSRKLRLGISGVRCTTQSQHPHSIHRFPKEQLLNEASDDSAIDEDNLEAYLSEEKLRPEHIFVLPNGVRPFSATEFESELEIEAWELLRSSVVTYSGNPVGTIAARDPTSNVSPLNYDQVFIRDFIPSAIAFLLKGEPEIVREFLLNTLRLQSWEKTVDCYNPGQGLMPASFKVRTVALDGDETNGTEEVLDPDFGEAAIGRVAPVDSGLWWIILLRAYGKSTGDYSLQERSEVQIGMKMILKLCLADGFDMFPSLLVTDGSCMIDRRMGIHGHPLEIQALFYSGLRCAREMLIEEDLTSGLTRSINSRLSALLFHVREYYWLDLRKLNEIYRYNTEEYSFDAVNKFNIYPDQIPPWLLDWMPDQGGYLMGNLQPAHMDFRFFSLGNLWSIVGSLSSERQSEAILDLIEARWKDFVGKMPFKIAFPALEREEWRIITGSDPKNTPWSYHNSGSWPVLLWQFTVACIKMGRQDLAQRAIEVAEQKLSKDRWPEYYDTRSGRLIGKQARLQQTWTIAGFLVSKMLLKNPQAASILTCDEDLRLLSSSIELPRRKRGQKSVLV